MNKKIIIFLFCGIMLLSACESKGTAYTDRTKEIPIKMVQGSYSIDINNPQEIVGDADYVFVGEVEELIRTEYVEQGTPEDRNGSIVTEPYTYYKVTVVENIKGELIQTEPIEVKKRGGLMEDGSYYQLFDEDALPEVGNTYIFTMYVQPDGTDLVWGPNSTIPAVKNEETPISTFAENPADNTDIVEVYEEAFENEILTDRIEYGTSEYDVSE